MALSAEKLKEMEAEMNRFEQEIALPVVLPHHLQHHSNMTPSRPVIGAHTYNRIAEQLQKQQLQIEHQAYNLNAMIGMYAEAVIPMDPSDQGLNSLQFIPHQLQMHHAPSDQSMVNMQQSSMDAQSMGDPSMLGAPPPGSMDEMLSGGSAGSYMTTTGNYLSTGGGNVMTTNMRLGEQPSPTPPVISVAPAVYAAAPVKVRKIVEQQTINTPTKPEQYRETLPPIEPPTVILPPPLPVKKAPTVVPSYEDSYAMSKKKEKERRRKCIRTAGGQTWEDTSLMEWEFDDFRIFCGDLGNDVTDEVLTRAFSKYPSFIRSKVIRDKRNNKTKGYGFVSFKDPQDFIKAMREMNGKYVGSRPIKLRKSTWRERNLDIVRKKHKEKIRLGLR